MKGRLLFIAPLPPPLTGQSVVSSLLLEHLKGSWTVDVIDYSKGSFRQGFDSLSHGWKVAGMLMRIIRARRQCDVAYLTISQSYAGNVKDLHSLPADREARGGPFAWGGAQDTGA
jgi:hypothetical protein